jgi:hypothetical protein
VLGRRVEDALLLELARLAAERGCAEVRVPFVPTARNAPALEFLRRVAPDAGEPIAGGLQFSFAVDTLLSEGLPDRRQADDGAAVAPAHATPAEPQARQDGRVPARAALLARIAGEFQTGAQVLAALAARHRAPARTGSHETVAPRTPVEHTLAAIWSEVLRVDQVGIHDSFFGLGGDSILIVQAVSRARAAGLPLTPRHIFEHRTIASLAEVIAGGQPPDLGGPAPADLLDEDYDEADLDTILAQLNGEF